MKTIIAAFCDGESARQAIDFLHAQGVNDAQLLRHGPDLTDDLAAFNVPVDKIAIYAELLRRGAPVLVAHTEDRDARSLARALDDMGSIDLEAAEQRWRAQGWDGYDLDALPYNAIACADEQAELRRDATQADGDRTMVTERPLFELLDEHLDLVRDPEGYAAPPLRHRRDRGLV